MSTFSVKTSTFEGPLDLLLGLIEERKLLISDVSLAQVADDFLTFISREDQYPVGHTAHFLVVAATLLLIKSRSLLPVLELSDDEEGDIKDLERRLALLALMKRAARDLPSYAPRMIAPGSTIKDPLFVPPPDLSPASLYTALTAALRDAPRPVTKEAVEVAHVVTIDEMIERLTKRVEQAMRLSFSDFSRGSQSPAEVVVSFLAVLELVKRGFASVSQNAHFDEITIEYAGGVSAPRYSDHD
jgi:segregation and condensation protein A